MKQTVTAVAGRLRIPTEEEVEVVEILLSLPKLFAKSELIGRYSFTWGRKKKRSVLDSKSESSPSPSPPTPLCFLPGGGNRKPPSSVRKSLKRKATDDLMELYNGLQQEREILMEKVKAIKTLHQELASENLELKARGQKISYSRNIQDFHIWNSPMKLIDQQRCHQQITMFATATPQQFMVDPNNGGRRFGLFNQIDPRVKIHGETYDFMVCSQPLDQSKYLVMDNDLRVRAAAAARKRRILRMKDKNSLLAMKLSRAWR
ncbi:hypothetical protein L1987_79077 [Smallanthus sonchifolius]|uniref:Uncharacterized protein n=1 Tax=Smallanthus sonchifolius TaxID=185202 RepID=A0ACB8ZEQ7_9ASTR|nr:hypothetical protein L1987_79077 [Smallanthus sonchifolius]